MEAFDEKQGIWRVGGKTCPKCSYEAAVPLKPPDAKVTKVWTLWCPRCSHTWVLKEPLEGVW